MGIETVPVLPLTFNPGATPEEQERAVRLFPSFRKEKELIWQKDRLTKYWMFLYNQTPTRASTSYKTLQGQLSSTGDQDLTKRLDESH